MMPDNRSVLWNDTLRLEGRVMWHWARFPLVLALLCGLADLGLSASNSLAGVGDFSDLEKSLFWGEMLLPMMAGWTGAQLVLPDAAREILQNLATPYWRIALRRLGLILAVLGAIWTAIFSLVAALLQVAEAGPLVLRILLGGWSTLLFFGSCGFSAAILLRDPLWGGLLTTLLWCGALALLQFGPTLALIYPFLTWVDAFHPLWGLNRLILVIVASLCLATACVCLRSLTTPPAASADNG